MQLEKLIEVLPKSLEDKKKPCIDMRQASALAPMIRNIRWFKTYDQEENINGSVYLFLEENKDVFVTVNRLHTMDKNDPRQATAKAVAKFKHKDGNVIPFDDYKDPEKGATGDYVDFIVEKACSILETPAKLKLKTNSERLKSDFAAILNSMRKNALT